VGDRGRQAERRAPGGSRADPESRVPSRARRGGARPARGAATASSALPPSARRSICPPDRPPARWSATRPRPAPAPRARRSGAKRADTGGSRLPAYSSPDGRSTCSQQRRATAARAGPSPRRADPDHQPPRPPPRPARP